MGVSELSIVILNISMMVIISITTPFQPGHFLALGSSGIVVTMAMRISLPLLIIGPMSITTLY